MGDYPQSGETSDEDGTGQKEDVIGTKSCVSCKSGESTSGQGSEACGSVGHKESHTFIDKRVMASDRDLPFVPTVLD
jgi:hypothetical protein